MRGYFSQDKDDNAVLRKIDRKDSAKIIYFLLGISIKAADSNQDGKTDISDAADLQMFLAEYELTNPIGEIIIE